MSKVDIKRLDSVTNNDTAATATINQNFENLQQAIENSLSRDGSTPNFMDADLDMNSYRIINGAAPENPKDFVTLEYFEEKIGDAAQYAEAAESYAGQAKSYAQQALVANSQAQAAVADIDNLKDAAISEITAEINKFELESATVIMSGGGVHSVAQWYQSSDVEGYPYKCDSVIAYTFDSSKNYSISGYSTLSIKDATSGNIAPIAKFEKKSTNDYVQVSLYAKEKPTENVTTMATVVFIKEI